jgi:hypothetical protein
VVLPCFDLQWPTFGSGPISRMFCTAKCESVGFVAFKFLIRNHSCNPRTLLPAASVAWCAVLACSLLYVISITVR